MTQQKRLLTPTQLFKAIALKEIPNITSWPGLPKTGKPLSLYPGDDGDTKIGLPPSGERFHVFGDGTVLDNVTGLMWVANPDLLPPPLTDEYGAVGLTWENAINGCNGLEYAGHNDWRLPNIKELLSITYIMESGVHIDFNVFTVYAFYYWSSTTLCFLEESAWVTEWVYGYTYGYLKDESELLVIPVRGWPKFL
jgi:hypothetical protein